MMGNTIRKLAISGEKMEAVERLADTARRFRGRWAARLGRQDGERPRSTRVRRIVISPAFGLEGFGVNPRSGHNAFPVTCGRDMRLDYSAKHSITHAMMALGVREIEVHGRGTDGNSFYFVEKGFPLWGQLLQMDARSKLNLRGIIATNNYYSWARDHKGGEWRMHNENNKSWLGEILGEGRGLIHKGSVRPPEAIVIGCSCSPIGASEIFEGHRIAVVSTLGNILSPVGLDAIGHAVNAGVPLVAVMGHSGCRKFANTLGNPVRAEYMNLLNSVEALSGERAYPAYTNRVEQVAGIIREKKTMVALVHLGMPGAEVTFLPQNF